MRPAISALILLLAITFSSCATQTPADEIRKEAETVYSWAESVKMVSEDWASGAVPARYAQRTLEKARTSMQDEIESFNKSNVPQASRAELLGHMQSLETLFGQMQSAIRQGDRNCLASSVDQLKIVQEQLNLLQQSGGS